MKLRVRSQTTDSIKPEVKEKKKNSGRVRRSERIKNDEKNSEIDLNKAKKDNLKRIKKKLLPKSKRRKTDDDTDNAVSESFYHKVIDTSLKDLLEQSEDVRHGDNSLLNEATMVYECRKCNCMFRVFTMFLKHKQSFCPGKANDSGWNPFMSKEIFELLPSSDDDSDDSDEFSCGSEDSAFEDGPSTSPKESDND